MQDSASLYLEFDLFPQILEAKQRQAWLVLGWKPGQYNFLIHWKCVFCT